VSAELIFGDTSVGLLNAGQAGAVTCATATTTVYTPVTGKRLRLRWCGFSMGSAGTECVVTVRFGGTQVLYQWDLSAPGAFSRRSGRQAINTDDALFVDISPAGGPVHFNYELEEL
jgi:hypothetical protein